MKLKNRHLEENNNLEEKLTYLKNRLLNYLKFRPRTEKESIVFLKKIIEKKNWSDIKIQIIIDRFKEWQLINDRVFIDWFVSSRKKLHPKGKQLIIYELKQKGIDQKLIADYFSKQPLNEEKLAFDLVKKYSYRWQNLTAHKRREKIIRFLISRGFSFETIKKVTKNLAI